MSTFPIQSRDFISCKKISLMNTKQVFTVIGIPLKVDSKRIITCVRDILDILSIVQR